MKKELFARRLLEAAVLARDFARERIEESLPDPIRFDVRLNQSFDGHPLHADERVFPDDHLTHDRGSLRRVDAATVVEVLWREGRIPEWIDVNVRDEDGAVTTLELVVCGRFTANETLLYHEHEGYPPFHVLGPALPVWSTERTRFSSIAHLSLRRTAVVDAEVAHLTALPRLQTLALDGTAITDAGACVLARVPTLARLWLADTAVTDATLAAFARHPALDTLDVSGTRVTAQALAALASARPALRLSSNA